LQRAVIEVELNQSVVEAESPEAEGVETSPVGSFFAFASRTVPFCAPVEVDLLQLAFRAEGDGAFEASPNNTGEA
jgi:hypothetical protein